MRYFKIIIIPLMLLFVFSGCSKDKKTNNEPVTGNITIVEQEQAALKQKAAISGDYVNLRTAPNKQGNIIKQLRLNAEVEVLSSTKNQINEIWYEIKDQNNQGWVIEQYVKISKAAAPALPQKQIDQKNIEPKIKIQEVARIKYNNLGFTEAQQLENDRKIWQALKAAYGGAPVQNDNDFRIKYDAVIKTNLQIDKFPEVKNSITAYLYGIKIDQPQLESAEWQIYTFDRKKKEYVVIVTGKKKLPAAEVRHLGQRYDYSSFVFLISGSKGYLLRKIVNKAYYEHDAGEGRESYIVYDFKDVTGDKQKDIILRIEAYESHQFEIWQITKREPVLLFIGGGYSL